MENRRLLVRRVLQFDDAGSSDLYAKLICSRRGCRSLLPRRPDLHAVDQHPVLVRSRAFFSASTGTQPSGSPFTNSTNVRPARVPVLGDGELVDRKPVVPGGVSKSITRTTSPAHRSPGLPVLDLHPVHHHPVKGPVPRLHRSPLRPRQLAVRHHPAHRPGQVGIQRPAPGVPQPPPQHHLPIVGESSRSAPPACRARCPVRGPPPSRGRAASRGRPVRRRPPLSWSLRLQWSGDSRVISVQCPFQRIVDNVLSGTVQFAFVSDNMLVVVALPQPPSEPPPPVRLDPSHIFHRRNRLIRPNHITQRRDNPREPVSELPIRGVQRSFPL